MSNSIDYINDEKRMLEQFINCSYMPNAFIDNPTEWKLASNVEFIVRPQCNQRCEYCYITQHGNELYPLDKRPSNDILLKNIKTLLTWIIKNKNYVSRYELFAGDLFGDNLFYDILDIFYEIYSSIPQIEHQRNVKKWGKIEIVTPTNGAYLIQETHQNKLREYTEKFMQLGLIIGISWSTDGLFASQSREDANKDKLTEQEYFDKIFAFTKEMAYGYHPMIAPENIENQCENFDWWMKMFDKYKIADRDKGKFMPTFLEVRNDYWTDEQIKSFVKLVRHVWDIKLRLSNDSIEKLARHLFLQDGNDGTLPRLSFYDFVHLKPASQEEKAYLGCNLTTLLRINVADMSLPTCHRLTYPQFTAGTFDVNEDGYIVGITPGQGASTWLQIRLMSPMLYPKCSSCDYNLVCLHGCLGAQFESCGELLCPSETVCKLEKAKIDVLLELYNSNGVIQIGLENNWIKDKEFKDWLIKMSNKGGYSYEGRYQNA